MIFHAKALEIQTVAYAKLNSIDEDEAVEVLVHCKDIHVQLTIYLNDMHIPLIWCTYVHCISGMSITEWSIIIIPSVGQRVIYRKTKNFHVNIDFIEKIL